MEDKPTTKKEQTHAQNSGLQRREFLRLAGLAAATATLGLGCKKTVIDSIAKAGAESVNNSALTARALTAGTGPDLSKVIFGITAKPDKIYWNTGDTLPSDKTQLINVESDIQANGPTGTTNFRFGGVRVYLALNETLDNTLTGNNGLTFTPKNQKQNYPNSYRHYIPLISINSGTRDVSGSITKVTYTSIYKDLSYETQLQAIFDQLAAEYGTTDAPVSGPLGTHAYPIVMTFNHEFDVPGNASCLGSDPTNNPYLPQQYAAAYNHIVAKQNLWQPHLNIKWTWIPYQNIMHNWYNASPAQPLPSGPSDTTNPINWWPHRNASNVGDLSQVGNVDIVGMDGYIRDNGDTFSSVYTPLMAFCKKVGGTRSTPYKWLIGEWGIDEWAGATHTAWKGSMIDDVKNGINATGFENCVYMSLWSTVLNNDNRYNSGPRVGTGTTSSDWGSTTSSGNSFNKFANFCAAIPALTGSNYFTLL